MTPSRTFAGILFLSLFLIAGCGSSNSNGNSNSANGSAEGPATRQATPLPLEPTFSSLSQNIFAPKCVSCHSGANPSGKTDLSGYDQLVHNTKHTDLVTPGKPENSHLYEMVHDGEMPPGGPALSANEVQAVSDWIMAGAPNN